VPQKLTHLLHLSEGEMASTPNDDCVLMAARTIAKIATSQLCQPVESIGDVLMELFKLTQIVNFKFELAAHLLDICNSKPALQTSGTTINRNTHKVV
jgi:hypothetical protein